MISLWWRLLMGLSLWRSVNTASVVAGKILLRDSSASGVPTETNKDTKSHSRKDGKHDYHIWSLHTSWLPARLLAICHSLLQCYFHHTYSFTVIMQHVLQARLERESRVYALQRGCDGSGYKNPARWYQSRLSTAEVVAWLPRMRAAGVKQLVCVSVCYLSVCHQHKNSHISRSRPLSNSLVQWINQTWRKTGFNMLQIEGYDPQAS